MLHINHLNFCFIYTQTIPEAKKFTFNEKIYFFSQNSKVVFSKPPPIFKAPTEGVGAFAAGRLLGLAASEIRGHFSRAGARFLFAITGLRTMIRRFGKDNTPAGAFAARGFTGNRIFLAHINTSRKYYVSILPEK